MFAAKQSITKTTILNKILNKLGIDPLIDIVDNIDDDNTNNSTTDTKTTLQKLEEEQTISETDIIDV